MLLIVFLCIWSIIFLFFFIQVTADYLFLFIVLFSFVLYSIRYWLFIFHVFVLFFFFLYSICCWIYIFNIFVFFFFFLQTGTLTEDGMNFKTMLPSREGKLDDEVSSHQTLLSMIASANREDDEPFPKLLVGMATCHSLTYINDKLCGDPLEIQVMVNHFISLVYLFLLLTKRLQINFNKSL